MSADDESFHPLGSEWEGELESMLDETDYDSDLGMEMAQDAMRVTKGDLSEAEFHEKYHDDVMAEFGVDDRPTEAAYEQAQSEDGGTVSRMLEAFEGDDEESRREAMKKMGAGAAAVGLGAWGTVDDGPDMNVAASEDDEAGAGDGDEGVQLGMVIDLERCDGCLSCMVACQEENQLDQGVNWMYVLDYEEPGGDSGLSRNRLVRPCQHCTDAPCEKVCPTTARHTRERDGLVLTDYDVCIGCRYCQVACPYGVNYFQWDEPDVSTDEIEEMHSDMDGDHMTDDRDRWVDSRAPRGTMSKCTMCPSRQDGHMGDDRRHTTACEEACPPNAINFGDMNDPESRPQQYVRDVVRTRAENMVDGRNPNRTDVEEAYAFLDGELDLLEMTYLEGDWDRDEIEAVRYLRGELEVTDLRSLVEDAIQTVLEEEFGDDLSDEEFDTLLDVVFRDVAEDDALGDGDDQITEDDLERAENAIADAEDDLEAALEEELGPTVVGILEVEFESELNDDELDEEDLETLAAVLIGDADEDEVDGDHLERAEGVLDDVIDESEESIQDVVDRYESREITPAEVEESLAILDGDEEPWVSEGGITDEETAQQVIESYAGGDSSTFKLLDDIGTNPNVTYIGNEPSPTAEQVEGPVQYDSVGLTDNRKDVLDEGTVGDAGVSL